MVTDPIADFLIRLQNAFSVGKSSVVVSDSKIVRALAGLLAKEGYIGEVSREKGEYTCTITLPYKNGRPTITSAKRISKPSRRVYLGARDVKPVKRGRGLLVLSTPEGVMTGKEAKQKHLGGEALFEVW